MPMFELITLEGGGNSLTMPREDWESSVYAREEPERPKSLHGGLIVDYRENVTVCGCSRVHRWRFGQDVYVCECGQRYRRGHIPDLPPGVFPSS